MKIIQSLFVLLLISFQSNAQEFEIYGGVFQDLEKSNFPSYEGGFNSDLGYEFGLSIDNLISQKTDRAGVPKRRLLHLRLELALQHNKSNLEIFEANRFGYVSFIHAIGRKTNLDLNVLPFCYRKQKFQVNLGYLLSVNIYQNYTGREKEEVDGTWGINDNKEIKVSEGVNHGPNVSIQYRVPINERFDVIPRLKYSYRIKEYSNSVGSMNTHRISFSTSLKF